MLKFINKEIIYFIITLTLLTFIFKINNIIIINLRNNQYSF